MVSSNARPNASKQSEAGSHELKKTSQPAVKFEELDALLSNEAAQVQPIVFQAARAFMHAATLADQTIAVQRMAAVAAAAARENSELSLDQNRWLAQVLVQAIALGQRVPRSMVAAVTRAVDALVDEPR